MSVIATVQHAIQREIARLDAAFHSETERMMGGGSTLITSACSNGFHYLFGAPKASSSASTRRWELF